VLPIVDPAAWQDLAHIFDPVTETCAFLVGQLKGGAPVVTEFWPTENTWQEQPTKSGKPGRAADQGYSIPAAEWRKAMAEAEAVGLILLGHCHTHPGSTARPSMWDYLAVKPGELGAVWHLRSGRFTLFDRARAFLRSYALDLPPLLRAYAECAGAADAVDLHRLPAPEPVGAPPVPVEVIESARQVARSLRDARVLRRAMVAAGIRDLRQTSITPERIAALEAALAAVNLH
jgi:proteasome lid subunit RPN8/RPN11